jgi:hypothetical protein
MVFKGKFLIRTKITADGNILKQVPHFSYLLSDITYQLDKDLNNKIKSMIKYVES